MNGLYLKQWLNEMPKDEKNKYIFIVNDLYTALAVGECGFKAISIDKQFSFSDFKSCIGGIENSTTTRIEYVFVLCNTQKMNKMLEDFFRDEKLHYLYGWKDFKDKKLSDSAEKQTLSGLLEKFVAQHSGHALKNPNGVNLLQFHLCNRNGEPTRVFDAAIVKYIKNKHPFFIMGSIPYIYENGAYFPDQNGTKLCDFIKELILPELANYNNVKRVYNLFFTESDLVKTYDEINQYPEHWICFRNCMYDGKTGETFPLDKKYFCINQIPWNYEPENQCTGDVTEMYLASAMSADDRITIFETLALFMTRDNSFQKFILLTGGRGTGKSALLRLYKNLLGKINVSSLPLQKIEEKFHSIQLLGRLANICGDLPGTALREVATIKQITGGDQITDSYKGCDLINFTPYCRLIFSANTIPLSLDEKSNAFFERLIIIDMDNKPEIPDRNLDEKLLSEMPYIIITSLKYLKKLYQDNAIFESTTCKQLVAEAYEDADSVMAFLNEKIVFDKTGQIKTNELFMSYKGFCEEKEREPLSRNNFYRNLKSKGIGKKKVHGVEFFSGIGWNLGGSLKHEGGTSSHEGEVFLPAENEKIPFD